MPTSPIFIVGANRSGTTLLRLILNAHPRIAIPDEVNYLNPWLVEHWRDTADDADEFRVRAEWCMGTLIRPEILGDIHIPTLVDRIVARSTVYDWRAPYQATLEAWAHHHGKARWGEKTPGNLFYVDTLQAMFPEAQFIHLVRDPRAGVQSMQRTSFFVDDVVINALNRRKYLREGLRRDACMPSEQWMRVRYEDLLTVPERTVRALCDFLGEAFTPAMLNYHEDAERFMLPAAASDYNRSARRPIDPGKVSAWRAHLRPADIAQVEAVCGREMKALGYRCDGARPSVYARFVVVLKSMYWSAICRRQPAPDFVVVDPILGRTRRRLAQLWHPIVRFVRQTLTPEQDSAS